MSQFVALFNRIVREEEGQDLVEYALLVGLIALVVLVGVTALGEEVNALFDRIADEVASWGIAGGGGGGGAS